MTYEDLKGAIGTWLNNRGSEPTLAANLDLFIELAEARINQDLRLQRMIARQDVAGSGLTSSVLPDDCLQVDRVIAADGTGLAYRPADETDATERDDTCTYAIDGRVLLFSGPLDGFVLRYYKRIDAIKDVGSTWLSEQSPNLYLYAALREANIFDLGEDREQARYENAYMGIVQTLQLQDDAAQTPQSDYLQSTASR